jgi:hypothetical protein
MFAHGQQLLDDRRIQQKILKPKPPYTILIPKTEFLKTRFLILPIFSYFFSFRCFHAVLSPFSLLITSAVQLLRSTF